MKVVLVDNVLMERTARGLRFDLQPHLGLISLVATLTALGHRAELYDPKIGLHSGDLTLGPHFYEAAAERILARAPDVVGFTSLGCNFIFTLKIAAAVRRRRPSVPVMLGGPHASIVDRSILERYESFDAILRGEAETTIGALIEALAGERPFADVAGLTHRRNGAVVRTADAGPILDLDALPMGAYDAYPIDALGLRTLDVDAGRGCPFSCAFCSTAGFFGRRYRVKSARRLVDELDRLAARYGIRDFGLSHDLFTVSAKHVRAFCAAVKDRGYRWSCSARMDCVDPALLREMREAGCTSMYYGVETGSPRLQRELDKRLDLALYEPTVAASRALGMRTVASFITGFPSETVDDREATLELIVRTMETHPEGTIVQLHLLAPEPGTALHARYGASLAYDGHTGDFNVPLLDAGDARAVAADPAVFVCHHFYDVGGHRATDIAVTQGFARLSALGSLIFAALARSFGASVSEMLLAFARVRERAADDDAAMVTFVRARWGADHPYVDLVRYALAVAALAESAGGDDAPAMAGAGADRIALSRRALPLAECRDGAVLLRRLRAGADIENAALPRVDRLLLAGRATPTAAQCFAIDPVMYALLAALREPAAYADLAGRFGSDELEPRLWALRLLGALAPTARAENEPASGPAPATRRRALASS
jgi:radical SAM superfamily enzyme YgiQ (UPF0313 family)